MQSKNMRYLYPALRKAKIKNSDNTKCLQGSRKTVYLINCWENIK